MHWIAKGIPIEVISVHMLNNIFQGSIFNRKDPPKEDNTLLFTIFAYPPDYQININNKRYIIFS